MGFYLDPPFGRGQVLGALWQHPTEKTDPLVTGSSSLGEIKQFTDVNPRTGAVLSNETVTCISARATALLTPGTAVTFRGYAGIVDEYLAKQVAINEIYWLVIGGPTQTSTGTFPALTFTRVGISVTGNGVTSPRMVTLPDGTEEEETAANNPAIRTPSDTTPDPATTDPAAPVTP
jgi:hypothetical protein